MGVSKNSGTPKWMVVMEHPIQIDDLGVPLFLETSIFLCRTNQLHPADLEKCLLSIGVLGVDLVIMNQTPGSTFFVCFFGWVSRKKSCTSLY